MPRRMFGLFGGKDSSKEVPVKTQEEKIPDHYVDGKFARENTYNQPNKAFVASETLIRYTL